ncbi:MAG: hypothetical protein KBC72_11340 [Acinetobacter sp.]|nr:hypothetical protein [Acinetobacter sp.]
MSEFSFLDYVDNYTGDAPQIVKNASQMTVDQLAEFTGFHQDTIKGWFKSENSPRKKIPTRHSWNLLIYMLEAKRKGYESLTDLVQSSKKMN